MTPTATKSAPFSLAARNFSALTHPNSLGPPITSLIGSVDSEPGASLRSRPCFFANSSKPQTSPANVILVNQSNVSVTVCGFDGWQLKKLDSARSTVQIIPSFLIMRFLTCVGLYDLRPNFSFVSPPLGLVAM